MLPTAQERSPLVLAMALYLTYSLKKTTTLYLTLILLFNECKAFTKLKKTNSLAEVTAVAGV